MEPPQRRGEPCQGLQEGRVLQDKIQNVCGGSQQKGNTWPMEFFLEFCLLGIFSYGPWLPWSWGMTNQLGTSVAQSELRLRIRISSGDMGFKGGESQVSCGPVLEDTVHTATSPWLWLLSTLMRWPDAPSHHHPLFLVAFLRANFFLVFVIK